MVGSVPAVVATWLTGGLSPSFPPPIQLSADRPSEPTGGLYPGTKTLTDPNQVLFTVGRAVISRAFRYFGFGLAA